MKPTIYLSNWSSHKTPGHHGPGRKYTIMVRPRRWEHGEGCIYQLMPRSADLAELRSNDISADDYFDRFRRLMSGWGGELSPGRLMAASRCARFQRPVEDGDTGCCSCARGTPCHRRIAAEFLHAAGWRVMLDGEEWSP